MKKITFNTLPEAISELIVRIEKIEKILTKRSDRTVEKPARKKRTNKRQETPAGLLGIKEAGKLLKMSVINLYSYVKNKKIPFEKRGRRLFFSKNALENWMKARNQQISSDHITIKDAEKLLKVPATTIYYKIRSQKLKPAARRGNMLYFSKKELINAFTKPTKRGRKAVKAGKPAKAKSARTAKTAKARKAVKVKKGPKAVKRGRPTRKAVVVKPEANGSKPAQPVKAAKPAPAKTAKPAAPKSVKPAPKAPKPVAAKAAKKAKPKKAKAPKPAVKPIKSVQPTPTPAPEPQKQPEKAPESQPPQNGNQKPENGNKA